MEEELEYEKDFDFSIWKKILRFGRDYRWYFIGLIAVMIAVAVIDAYFPMLTRRAVDKFVVPQTTEGLGRFALWFAAVVVVQVCNVWMLIAFAGKLEAHLTYEVRKTGFKRLQELSFGYYDKTAVGWIMARMTSDATRLGEVVSWGIVDIVWGFTMMAAIAVFMLFMDWRLALVTLSVMPILIWASRFFQSRILASHRKVRKANSRISGSYNEGISGAKTTKTLHREKANYGEFQVLSGTMRGESIRAATYSALYLPVVLTLGSIGTALALWIGGLRVMSGDVITYGTLVAFLTYTVQFFEPVRELARVLSELQSAQASAERIISMIETEPDIQDTDAVTAIYGTAFDPVRENWPKIKGDVEFRDVTFFYKEGETVLENFSLSVSAGETIALVGETGSGKSTIVNLACRFYEPKSGSVLIDGVDYRERSQLWLHSDLGYVLQQPWLFSGTIAENIRYGRLEASDEEVEEAARLVHAEDFILKLSDGYQTKVGEGGSMLSVGEKQLISFARAILADPAIFVLDEATSSVDTETEQKIQWAIGKVMEERTSFIVAHRLSTIRAADRIIVLNQGRIEEMGSHEELLSMRGHYYRLYANQFLEERESAILSEEKL